MYFASDQPYEAASARPTVIMVIIAMYLRDKTRG